MRRSFSAEEISDAGGAWNGSFRGVLIVFYRKGAFEWAAQTKGRAGRGTYKV
jgi:hypothetical protein